MKLSRLGGYFVHRQGRVINSKVDATEVIST